MLSTPKIIKKNSAGILNEQAAGPYAELQFISEFSQSVSAQNDPVFIARKTVELLLAMLDVKTCALAGDLSAGELISFTGGDENGTDLKLNKSKITDWISDAPNAASFVRSKSMWIAGGDHAAEFVTPLTIGGKIGGAIIIGLEADRELSVSQRLIVDTVSHIVAMAFGLSVKDDLAIKASLKRAREEHQKFTGAILDTLPLSLYVIDRDFKIVAWNRHREIGSQGIPRDQAVGKNVFEVLTRQPQAKLKNEFERGFKLGKIERIEQRTTDENGATRHWLISKIPMRDERTGEVTHVISVGEDITMRVDAIHAVSRAEKLAAVGRLAAGVVHEINNPLATISACAESMETRANEGAFSCSADEEDLKEYLGLIRSETFRCKSITDNLLNFSRLRSGNWAPVNMEKLVLSSIRLLEHQKRKNNIEIKLDFDKDLPCVNGDEGKIQQAVIALASNAIDAMPEGGMLSLGLSHRSRQLALEINDTGIGISAEDMPKIFEPFFTTKEVGKGTGLGLAVSYGIVTEHQGKLSVRSHLGRGTTFTMYLPQHEARYEEDSQEKAAR
jgi:two-component system NtrC family sensor kinase